jgi:hypothetical protein
MVSGARLGTRLLARQGKRALGSARRLVQRLKRAIVPYQVIAKFAELDLHPEVISNIEMDTSTRT